MKTAAASFGVPLFFIYKIVRIKVLNYLVNTNKSITLALSNK